MPAADDVQEVNVSSEGTFTADDPSGIAAVQSAAVAQAAEWFARNRAGELTGAEKTAFMEWLRASPLHVSEYLAAVRLAEDLPEVAARLRTATPELLTWEGPLSATNVIELASSKQTSQSSRRRYSWSIGIAAAAGLLVAALFWGLSVPGLVGLPRAVEVAHGEQRTLQLRDGSVVHLNTDSRIKVRYSRAERLIELQKGQVMFQVSHDATRPFRVRAGDAAVVAVGTQFEVYRKSPDELTVTVVEGRVDVVRSAFTARNTAATRNDTRGLMSGQTVRLTAGERIQVSSSQTQLRALPVDLRVATAWVQREIVFNQQPLSVVAAEFDRYSSVPIIIEDPTLRELRVSGIFKAYDTDSFVGFLQQFDGVRVEQDATAVRVRSRSQP